MDNDSGKPKIAGRHGSSMVIARPEVNFYETTPRLFEYRSPPSMRDPSADGAMEVANGSPGRVSVNYGDVEMGFVEHYSSRVEPRRPMTTATDS